MSGSKSISFENSKMLMTRKNISENEVETRGQNENHLWFICRKSVITVSRTH